MRVPKRELGNEGMGADFFCSAMGEEGTFFGVDAKKRLGIRAWRKTKTEHGLRFRPWPLTPHFEPLFWHGPQKSPFFAPQKTKKVRRARGASGPKKKAAPSPPAPLPQGARGECGLELRPRTSA